MLLSNCEFRENPDSEVPYSRVYKILPAYVYGFSPMWIRFGTEDVCKNIFSSSEFRENRRNGSHILYRTQTYFCPYFPDFLPDLGEIRCKKSAHNAA